MTPSSPQQPGPWMWADIQQAARSDPDSTRVRQAVFRAEREFRKRPQGPEVWFFADGNVNFVGQLDGAVIGSSPTDALRFTSVDGMTARRLVSGQLHSVMLDGQELLNPRPIDQVERLLSLHRVANVEFNAVEPTTQTQNADGFSDLPKSEGDEVEAHADKSVGEALTQLADLKLANLVTAEEYAAKRAEILSRL